LHHFQKYFCTTQSLNRLYVKDVTKDSTNAQAQPCQG
jgi:hypothetical protein